MVLTRLAKDSIKRLAHALGYDFYKLDKNFRSHGLYEPVRPRATYAPWRNDETFLELYRHIHANTLVDKYRCFELWSIVEQLDKFDGGLIEVGVWKGGTGAVIAKKAQMCGMKTQVYLCDTFAGVVKASGRDSTYRGGEHQDTSREVVERLLHRLGITNVIILEGVFPDGTAHLVAQQTFKFCHVDVDTYDSARDIVNWIWDKMVVGGIMVYDDYGFEECDGITNFVDEQRSYQDRAVIHNLNGHGVVVKTR